MIRIIITLLVLLIGFADAATGQAGRITGTVVDAETREPLIGANLVLSPGKRGSVTNASGDFQFEALSVGSYVLRISYIGYQSIALPDVIVRVNRLTQIDAELVPAVLETDEVVISAGFFSDTSSDPTSVAAFGAEEIRRAAGAGGDISRILNGLPSLARVDDMTNSLVVRGGSPMENGFYIENILIPNINHFPTQGSSGGPIGLINVDLIRDVTFNAGGFSATYGNRLSSIMNIDFREGNREETDVQLDLNFTGIGAVAEGPLAAGRGSWLVSARRSYLDFLIDTVFKDEAGAALPVYSDYQGKAVFDLNARNEITVLGIRGVDRSEIKESNAREEGEVYFGAWKNVENTAGVNWRYLWHGAGVSQTSISHGFVRYDLATSRVASGNALYRNHSLEQHFRMRHVSYYRWNSAHRIEFGVEAEYERTAYDHRYEADVDVLGRPTPVLEVDETLGAVRMGGFASHRWSLDAFELTAGIRFDHYTYTDQYHLSPRISASYRMSARTSLNAAAGLYRQTLPLVILSQNRINRTLADPGAVHAVLGIQHLLAEDTRLTVEAYTKAYRHFPVDAAQPSLFIIDQLFYDQNVYLNHAELLDSGRAMTHGVEAMVQKKLSTRVYGLVSGSYFRSRYRGGDETWRNRVFDNRFIASIEGGYRPNEKHAASLKWTVAGGRPYTPFDEPASVALGRGVFDETRVNGERLPTYHSLSVRYDRRFYFQNATLVTFLSVWNVYGRRNIAAYIWNELENRKDTIEQWGTLPIFGVELEF